MSLLPAALSSCSLGRRPISAGISFSWLSLIFNSYARVRPRTDLCVCVRGLCCVALCCVVWQPLIIADMGTHLEGLEFADLGQDAVQLIGSHVEVAQTGQLGDV